MQMTNHASTPLSLAVSAGLLFGLVVAAVLLAFAGFVPTPSPDADPSGFWGGSLHGFLIFGALIVSFVEEGAQLVATAHQGQMYNLGFYVGASLWFICVIKLQGAVKAGFDRAEEKLLTDED